MTPQQQAFVSPFCAACLQWEASTEQPYKRQISIVTVAQAVLETGWGASSLSKPPINNYGGIKYHLRQWPAYSVQTREVISGESQVVPGTFQTYPTVADYIADHAAILTQWQCVRDVLGLGLAALCEALGPWTDEDRKTPNPSHANYSTDPNYPNTLMKIINQLGLTDPTKIEQYAAMSA
ncbi:MAG TPA: glucosaminidase domain-containing protein [Terriglobia bacterium]|nr:glucosaminidase domain-containing protein [Terriglobia bacterium]